MGKPVILNNDKTVEWASLSVETKLDLVKDGINALLMRQDMLKDLLDKILSKLDTMQIQAPQYPPVQPMWDSGTGTAKCVPLNELEVLQKEVKDARHRQQEITAKCQSTGTAASSSFLGQFAGAYPVSDGSGKDPN